MSCSPSKLTSRRRERDSSHKKKKKNIASFPNKNLENEQNLASNDDLCPIFSWRTTLPSVEMETINCNEYRWVTPSKSVSPTKTKSYGLSPSRFYNNNNNKENAESNSENNIDTTDSKSIQIPPWKQTTEHNLLIQQRQQHIQQLEQRRKQFRSQTLLKIWPLQDMAMEHLDHLLICHGNFNSRNDNNNNNNHNNQHNTLFSFHGGECLSSESSSSVSSGERTSRPRLAQTDERLEETTISSHYSCSVKVERSQRTYCKKQPTLTPLSQDTTTPFHQQQQSSSTNTSPLWSMEPRIFAIEKSQGKRKYLVGHFGRIADWYWRKAVPPRHLYEVIREDTPCRLYLDLEYSKVYNNDNKLITQSTQLLQELQEELAVDLKKHYQLNLESSQIINLDSSNDTKFSRHWIIHLREDQGDGDFKRESEDAANGNDGPKSSNDNTTSSTLQEVLFRNAQTVGRFVKRLVSRLAEEKAVDGSDFAERRPMLSEYLFVNTKDANKPTCFIDLGVYTRNRLFRCLGSSKFGKTTTLQAIHQQQDHGGGNWGSQQYFSLDLPLCRKKEIDSSHQSSQLLSIKDFVIANDWEPHAKALADSLVVPLQEWLSTRNDDCNSNDDNVANEGDHKAGNVKRILDVKDETYAAVTARSLLLSGTNGGGNTLSRSTRAATTISMARQPSQLPALDQFVNKVLAVRGGTQGSVRAWSVEYSSHGDTPVSITYQMQKNRFCELIGRSHKSNNIFWTVDLTLWTCVQGCYDPDCRGRGSPVPIPNDNGRLDFIKKQFEAWREEEFEKALMSLNIEDIVIAHVNNKNKNDNNNKTTPASSSLLPTNTDQKLDQDDSAFENLSDEALWEAIIQNPELFP
jgi:hypothetical protein